MSFIEWSQLLHGIKLVAHVLQDWQSSVIFKTASPNPDKPEPKRESKEGKSLNRTGPEGTLHKSKA
jgi:hypothetical protein